MSEPRFTPGPWYILHEGSDLFVEPGIAYWSKHDITARTEEEIEDRWRIIQSNAKLIQKSPEMIEFICDIYETEQLSPSFLERAEKIICETIGEKE